MNYWNIYAYDIKLLYRHTAYQVVLLQAHLKDAYLQVTAMMNPKRNLAKQTYTLGAFHQEQLMMI